MNAIISLCHFCTDHGPRYDHFQFYIETKLILHNNKKRTLFCTQAFKYVDDKDFNLITNGNNLKHELSVQDTTASICKACRAFEKTFLHYISYEDSSKICYVSQSTPADMEIYNLVRKGM